MKRGRGESTVVEPSDNLGHSDSKKLKKNFNEIEFKFMLRDPNTTFSGLENFIAAARGYPENTDYDLVTSYCQSSKEAAEIFNILEAGKRKPTELASIFDSLECILIRTADDLKKFESVGQTIVHSILTQHMGALMTCVRPNNKSSHIKAALKLLCAMVAQSESCASDVQTSFDFRNPGIPGLLKRRDGKDPQDVRTCLLQFAMSFLVYGGNLVIRTVMEQKGFLNGLFAGMCYDRMETIQMILETLLDKVIQNPTVSKTLKIKLFNETTLKTLIHLYKWKGPSKWKESKKKNYQEGTEAPVDDEDLTFVQQVVQKFLLEACCSQKWGITFNDKTYGTSGRNMNHVLTNILNSLTNVTKCDLSAELAVNVLKACPDQLQRYLGQIQHSFNPRHSDTWLKFMRFLDKIYENQPDVAPALKNEDVTDVHKLVVMSLVTSCPPPPVMGHIRNAVKNQNATIRHTALRSVLLIMKKARAVQDFCRHMKSTTKQDYDEFIQRFRESLSRILPDIQSITYCWSAITKNKQDDSQMETLDESQTAEHMGRILQVMCRYQQLFPELYSERPVDYASLLQGVQSLDVESSVLSVLQLYVLQLLADSDASRLAFAREGKGKSSILSLLLELVMKTSCNKNLRTTAIYLTVKLLLGTGVFDAGHREELHIWLSTMAESSVDEQIHITRFLENVMSKAISSPFKYVDKAVELVTGSNREPGLFSGEGDFYASSSSDTISEGLRIPFSLLSLSAAETLETQTGENHQVLQTYSCKVLLSILHGLDDPTPLAELVSQHASVLPTLQPVVSTWLHDSVGKSINDKAVNYAEISSDFAMHLLKSFHLEKCGLQTRERLMSSVKDVPKEKLVACVHQLLLYLKTVICRACKDSPSDNLKKMIKLYFTVLHEIPNNLVSMDTGNEEGEPNVLKSELSMVSSNLGIPKILPEELRKQIFNLILRQPFLYHWFLHSDKDNSNDPTQKAIAKMATENLCQILGAVKCDSAAMYAQKMCAELSKAVEGNRKMVGKRKDLFLAVRTTQALLKHEEIVRVLDQLLILAGSANNVEEGDLTMYRDSMEAVLQHLTSDPRSMKLSKRCVENLTSFIQNAKMERLDELFLHLLQKDPLNALSVPLNFLLDCLNCNSETKLNTANIVVMQSIAMNHAALEWLNAHTKKWQKNMKVFAPFVKTVLMFDEVNNSILVKKLRKLMWSGDWLERLESVDVDGPEFALQERLLPDATLDLEAILSQLSPSEVPVQFHVYKAVCSRLEALAGDLNERVQRRVDLVGICIRSLPSFCANKETSVSELILGTAVDAVKGMEGESSFKLGVCEAVTSALWKPFVKAALRHMYGSPLLSGLLCQLIPLLYDDKDMGLPLGQLYEMMISHSLFLSLMMDGDKEQASSKESLVRLMVCIVEMDGSTCETSHLSVLFSAYNATLGETDKLLLRLIHLYESNGADLTQYRPYLWGPRAVEYHAGNKNKLGRTLSSLPSASDLIDMLDASLLEKSALNFPLARKLQPCKVKIGPDTGSRLEFYDPCFVLPLLSYVVEPGSLLPCRKFVESNCLGYVVTALSSHDAAMRGAACHILTNFKSHVEGARSFSDGEQILYALECVRNSMDKENGKVPCIITTFLMKTFRILTKPEEHMYVQLNSFLLLKPGMDLFNVPEFYKLFNSSYLEFKQERSWMLNLLHCGLRETADYHIFQRRYVFKLLLSFYDSSVSEDINQIQILRIVKKACSIKTVVYDLVKNHGLLSWLSNAVQTRSSHSCSIQLIISCLHTIWFTILGHKDGVDAKTKCLPMMFINEFLITLLSVLQASYILNTLEVPALEHYLETLNSVLQQQEAAHAQYRANNYSVTLVNVCGHHIVCLLQKLAIVSKDTVLLSATDALTCASGVVLKSEECASTDMRRLNKMEGFDQALLDNGSVTSEEHVEKCRRLVYRITKFWNPNNGADSFSQNCALSKHEDTESRDLKSDEYAQATCLLILNWVLKQHAASIDDVSQTVTWCNSLICQTCVGCECLLTRSTTAKFIISKLLGLYGQVFMVDSYDGRKVELLGLVERLNEMFVRVMKVFKNSKESDSSLLKILDSSLDNGTLDSILKGGNHLEASLLLRQQWID